MSGILPLYFELVKCFFFFFVVLYNFLRPLAGKLELGLYSSNRASKCALIGLYPFFLTELFIYEVCRECMASMGVWKLR